MTWPVPSSGCGRWKQHRGADAGRWSPAVSAITLTDLDSAAGLMCRHKMINDKYQTLLCRALMSARKE